MMDPRDFVEAKSLKHYLESISRFRTPTEAEEKELARRIQGGDEGAVRELVEGHLKFVVSIVKRYSGMGLGYLDLIHEGNLGLMEAARRFDPDRGVKFITYAVWWIRQAVIHALTQNAHIYNLPQKLSDQISRMKKVKERLRVRLGRMPTREEVARSMKVSPEEIADLEIMAEKDVSLQEKLYEDDQTVEDTLGDTEASVEKQVIDASVRSQVIEMLDHLDDKEARVLKLRFGLEGKSPLTLQKIGDELNLTRERVRQIERKAIRKLSQSRKLRQLRGYLN